MNLPQDSHLTVLEFLLGADFPIQQWQKIFPLENVFHESFLPLYYHWRLVKELGSLKGFLFQRNVLDSYFAFRMEENTVVPSLFEKYLCGFAPQTANRTFFIRDHWSFSTQHDAVYQGILIVGKITFYLETEKGLRARNSENRENSILRMEENNLGL